MAEPMTRARRVAPARRQPRRPGRGGPRLRPGPGLADDRAPRGAAPAAGSSTPAPPPAASPRCSPTSARRRGCWRRISRPRGWRTMAGLVARWGATNVRSVVRGRAAAAVARVPCEAVLLDAPCSGLGTLGRHPDIRWRARAADLAGHARRQRELLEGVAPLVAAGRHARLRDLQPRAGGERAGRGPFPGRPSGVHHRGPSRLGGRARATDDSCARAPKGTAATGSSPPALVKMRR